MENKKFAFTSTVQGYNHIKNNKVCEDASDFYDEGNIQICVVADAHGSDNYPRTYKGSKFAVDAAIKSIVEFVEIADANQVLQDEKNGFSLLIQLSKSILNNWYDLIEKDYEKNPFSLDELEPVSERYKRRYINENPLELRVEKAYGTTLVAFCQTEQYCFGLQIGDGKCAVFDKNCNFNEPIPDDENCQLNVTTSICDSDAIEEFRFYVSNELPLAVLCGTDGIDDSYASKEELYSLYRGILKVFADYDEETGKKEIEEYLPLLTKRGSGDDVSIGIIVDSQRLKSISELLNIQTQLSLKKYELAKREQSVLSFGERKNALTNKMLKASKNNNPLTDLAKQIDDASEMQKNLDKEISDLLDQIDILEMKYNELINIDKKLDEEVKKIKPIVIENDTVEADSIDEIKSDNVAEILDEDMSLDNENPHLKQNTIS